jgi:spore germination protein KC
VNDKEIKVDLNIASTAAIDEIEGTRNFMDEKGLEKLEESAEKKLKDEIEALVEKIQTEYDTDIFGFGTKLREDRPREWKRVSSNWEEIFKDLKVNVMVKIHIRNSAMLSKPLKGDD